MQALRDSLPAWFTRTPSVRRPMTRLLRLHWRMQRATLASAVVVVRSNDGKVLVISDASGTFGVPRKQLDGWMTIPHQVEDWLNQLLTQPAAISLVTLEGSCGDVTLLYTAKVDTPPALQQARFLSPDIALTTLDAEDARLLRLTIGDAR